MSDTPETDAELHGIKAVCKDDYMLDTMADFARKLERERNYAELEMRKWMAFAQSALGERDEARKLVQQMSESNQVILADLRHYREEWKKLKEGAA